METETLNKKGKTAIIIGAGPAGLTAALDLLEKTDIVPIVIDQNPDYVGGISKTVVYKGNRIDIGGHRFFSKSDRVMSWWLKILPLENRASSSEIAYHNRSQNAGETLAPVDPDSTDEVMLVRHRVSRIFYNKNFFDYPISLSAQTISQLGLVKVAKMGVTYFYRLLRPIKPENNLEAFFTNRFGDELYRTFFQSYTEKVWGIPCDQISADWGAQRVKGLSIMKAITHAIKKIFAGKESLEQKGTETSLIESFLYPKLGPGQLWEAVAKKIVAKGGQVVMGKKVNKIQVGPENKILSVTTIDVAGQEQIFSGDLFFSTMPIKDLIESLSVEVPDEIREISAGLRYRDFVTAGLLVSETDMKLSGLVDNWIYIHDQSVLVGRIQIFNNWSPYLIADGKKRWIGLEYFCNEGDNFWNKTEVEILELAKKELVQIGLADLNQIEDGVVIREKKAYPAYFGTYDRFPILRSYLQSFSNLYPLGRNGMHRYNNQDHSMLTAMMTVDVIAAGEKDTDKIWDVNTEQEYHEEKEK